MNERMSYLQAESSFAYDIVATRSDQDHPLLIFVTVITTTTTSSFPEDFLVYPIYICKNPGYGGNCKALITANKPLY